ncbi:STE20-related kinase adapter protein alpha [Lamellibrachia satsuma]|nr:STE20-related kinase adapter protein alpha [Lamellibrachia satsuma]
MSLLVCICNRKRPREVENLSNNALEGHQMDTTHSSSHTAQDMSVGFDRIQPNARDFHLLTCIGQGCYNSATISLVRHQPNKKLLAIKRIHLEMCEIEFSMIVHEIVMHQQLRHKNILESYGAFVHDKEIWLTLPLMGYGSCRDLLRAHFVMGIPELTVVFILREVLNGLDYLHKWNIIHRSVQASHILISATGQVCLSGLRHCCSMVVNGVIRSKVHNFPTHFVNSLQWASPELLEQNLAGYNTKSDIYSVGITACELANGVVPFADMPLTQMLLEKVEGTIPRLLDSPTPTTPGSYDEGISEASSTTTRRSTQDSIYHEMPAAVRVLRNFSNSFHNFVKTCLQHVGGRPSAEQLMQHNFFKQIRKRSCQYMLPELLRPVTPITDATKIPEGVS